MHVPANGTLRSKRSCLIDQVSTSIHCPLVGPRTALMTKPAFSFTYTSYLNVSSGRIGSSPASEVSTAAPKPRSSKANTQSPTSGRRTDSRLMMR
eukprot:3323241-Pyramimonas_sp.AAC.1